jgi:UDP-N-acetylglucosamine--N-acetylmuramyl-(pentapeptide) pyrophosphoryl-undecaprenol N-acetylglucosamine transferase
VAYDRMDRFFDESKIIKTGNPVRSHILNVEGKRNEAFNYFKLDTGKKTVLVVGGSLGARTVNKSIEAGLNEFMQQDIQVIWQTGRYYYDEIKSIVNEQLEKHIKVHAFIQNMDLAYAAADIIVSRAGAGTISELSIVGKPCIFIPSPNVAEDHQTKNAKALVDKNAASLIKDVEAIDKLSTAIIELLNNSEQLKELSYNIKQFALPNAAENIVHEIFKLAEQGTQA